MTDSLSLVTAIGRVAANIETKRVTTCGPKIVETWFVIEHSKRVKLSQAFLVLLSGCASSASDHLRQEAHRLAISSLAKKKKRKKKERKKEKEKETRVSFLRNS